MDSLDGQGKDQHKHGALAGEIGRDGVHRYKARIYYADTDFSGAVYHARYLEFLERGRSDFLRCAGIHHTDLQAGLQGEVLYWVVRRMEIDYRASARIDDLITVETAIDTVGGARIVMAQRVLREGHPLVVARVTAALINADGKPRRFLRDWTSVFAEFADKQS